MLGNSDLVETILQIDVSKNIVVGDSIYVESDVRKRTMVSYDVLVDDSKITTYTNIWGSCFGCNSDVGGYRGCRRDQEISAKAVEFFLGDFEDCRRNLSCSRFETGRQLLGEFNMDEVNTLNSIPVLFEVGKYYYTFIFHELEDVGSFGELWINMGLHEGIEGIHLL